MLQYKSDGKQITCTHNFKLAQIGAIPAVELSCTMHFTPGLDLKSDLGKDLGKRFEATFPDRLHGELGKLEDKFSRARLQLARMLKNNDPQVKMKTFADSQQEALIADWNNFHGKYAERIAIDVLGDSAKLIGKAAEDEVKKLKPKFSFDAMSDSKANFMTGVLGADGAGAVNAASTGNVGALIPMINGAGAQIGVSVTIWDGNEQIFKQSQISAGSLASDVGKISKAVQTGIIRIARIEKLRVATRARIVKATIESQKAADVLTKAMRAALKGKDSRQIRVIDATRRQVAGTKAEALKLRDSIAPTDQILKLLTEAKSLIDQAEALAKGNAGSANDAASKAKSISKDLKTGASALSVLTTRLRG
ncbi:MAG: hypothetical protein WD046_10625 [Paracoccaceae bacterium]